MVAASSAMAGGPIIVCNSGSPFLWPNGGASVPFNPDQGNLGPLSHDDAVAKVTEAFAAWEAVPTATISFVNAGPLPVDVDVNNFYDYLFPVAPDGLSAIVFDDTGEIFDLLYGPGSGILGFAGPEWIDLDNCTIIEGVAFLNGPAFTDPVYALDVMVHEFGHYSGLGHAAVNGQLLIGDTSGPTPDNTFGFPDFSDIETMYPYYFGPGSGTSTLAKDDISSIASLYPTADFAANSGTIKGTIKASNGQPLTGINVIARNIANPFGDAVSAISGDYVTSIFAVDPNDPFIGTYTFRGLTPGAQYAVFIDEIIAGGFSTPLISPFPGPEEFYNGAGETDNLTVADPPLNMTPVSAAAGATVSGVDVIINMPRPGEPLRVGDDGFVQLPLPFRFEIVGKKYDTIFVNANGNLTFGRPDFNFTENSAAFLSGPPRIAALWDDLNPAAGGTVTYQKTDCTFSVIWSNVPEFPNVGAVSFEIKLYKAFNWVEIRYGATSALDGLAGVSGGGVVTSGFETPTDLSSRRWGIINLILQPAVYEVFTAAAPNDLGGVTLWYTGTTDYNDRWLEPNNTIKLAKPIKLPFDSKSVLRYTEIEPAGADVDYFKVTLKAGDILLARTIGGQLDTMLGLFRLSGKWPNQTGTLVVSDDDSGPGLLSTIVFIAPSAGEYALAATTFPDFNFTGAGFGTGRYVLDVSVVKPDPNNPILNGSFETGDFLFWNALQTSSPFIPWLVLSAGFDSGYGMAPSQPQDGMFDALNGFDGSGPMHFLLYQDVTIRAGATSATLEWKDRMQWNFFVATQTEPRLYEVQLRDPVTDAVLETIHSADTGIADGLGDTGWVSHSNDVSNYIGQKVRIVFVEYIPEAFTGPGQYELDAVRLNVQ
jgi:hypothetical protein